MFWAVFTCFVSYLCLGRLGGGQTGLVHNLLMQPFSLDSWEIEVSKIFFLVLQSPKLPSMI